MHMLISKTKHTKNKQAKQNYHHQQQQQKDSSILQYSVEVIYTKAIP